MAIFIIQDNISEVFAKPEREQPAAWIEIIETMDEIISTSTVPSGKAMAIEARDIYIAISREAKYFS